MDYYIHEGDKKLYCKLLGGDFKEVAGTIIRDGKDVYEFSMLTTLYKGNVEVYMGYALGLSILIKVEGGKLRYWVSEWKSLPTKHKYEVAETRAKAKHKVYIDKKGFCDSLEKSKAAEGQINGAMLLSRWDETKEYSYPMVCSPKYDGIRGLYRSGKMYTRGGQEISGLGRLLNELPKDIDLDGELWEPNLTLQEIQSIVLGSGDKGIMQYRIFDIIESDVPFWQRLEKLLLLPETSHSRVVPYHPVNNVEEANKRYQRDLQDRYEGTVYRTLTHTYVDKRSTEVRKRKPLQSTEFYIDEVLRDKNGLVYFSLVGENGCNFKSVSSWTTEIRKEDFNCTLGHYATVEYYDRTDKGLPKFSSVITIRDMNKKREVIV